MHLVFLAGAVIASTATLACTHAPRTVATPARGATPAPRAAAVVLAKEPQAKALPTPGASAVCRIEGKGRPGAVLEASGTPLVQLDAFLEMDRPQATLDLRPGSDLASVRYASRVFVFHGEARIGKLEVHSRDGVLAATPFTHRTGALVDAGSVRDDGTVALADPEVYGWFSPLRADSVLSKVRARCADTSLERNFAAGNWGRSQGGASLPGNRDVQLLDAPGGKPWGKLARQRSVGDVTVDVLVLERQNGFTKIDVELGPDLHGIGWVASGILMPPVERYSTIGRLGGETPGAPVERAPFERLRCGVVVPLWARVGAPAVPTLVELGAVNPEREFRGQRFGEGDFYVDVGTAPFEAGRGPFVAREKLEEAACKTVGFQKR